MSDAIKVERLIRNRILRVRAEFLSRAVAENLISDAQACKLMELHAVVDIERLDPERAAH